MVELADGICLESRRTARFRGFKSLSLRFLFWQRIWIHNPNSLLFLFFIVLSRMPRHSCCEVRVMQLHDILLLRTSAILPEAISAGGLTPTTDTSLFLTTYRGGSHLPADIFFYVSIISINNYLQFFYNLTISVRRQQPFKIFNLFF